MIRFFPFTLKKFDLKWFLYIALFFSILYRALVEYLGIPSAIRYFIDLLLFAVLLYTAASRLYIKISQKTIFLYVFLYFIYCIVAYIFRFQSLIYLIYGIIFQFRYYIFVLLCLIYFDQNDVKICLKGICNLFYINAIFVLVQFSVFGLYGDFLGGIFGKFQGCNSYLNTYLIVVLIISCFQYFEKTLSLRAFLIKVLVSMAIAAVAELKFFFVEFIVFLVFAVFCTGFSWKKIVIAAGGSAMLCVGFFIFTTVYSYGADFIDPRLWIQLASSGAYSAGYSGVGEINRLTFASVITDFYFHEPSDFWIGLGIGNCAKSSIALFNTPFYMENYETYYDWFTTSYTLVEQGWVGFFFFVGYFVLVFFNVKKLKERKKASAFNCFVAEAAAIISGMLLIYNNSLTSEAGFMVYFLTAVPYISNKQRRI